MPISSRYKAVVASLISGLLCSATSYQVNHGSNLDITEHAVCRNVENNHASGRALFVPTNTSGEWSTFYGNSPANVTVTACNTCGGSFTVSSNASNINLFTIAGSPTCTGGTWTITINPGVAIHATATGTAALVTGSWPSGSSVTLVNNGTIYGKGGNGSAGAQTPTAGAAGGPAISLGFNLTINNTNGYIYGGGGGGGGGSRGANAYSAGGGGGGGIGVRGLRPAVVVLGRAPCNVTPAQAVQVIPAPAELGVMVVRMAVALAVRAATVETTALPEVPVVLVPLQSAAERLAAPVAPQAEQFC